MKKIFISILCLILLSLIGCKKEGVSLITATLRDKPETKKGAFKWVKTVNRGQVVKIVEKKKDGEWFMVQLPDGETKGWIEKKYIHEGTKKIVDFTEKTDLYDQPDADSKVKANLPAGSNALVLKEKGDWTNVSVSWALSGWVKKGTFKKGSDMAKQGGVYEIYISGIGKCTVEASSTLPDSGGFTYSPKNLFDKNPGTTWQEGDSGSGVGEWIEVNFPGQVSVSIAMINGFAKKDAKYANFGADGDLYVLNNRVKSMKVEYWGSDDSSSSKMVRFEDEIRDFQDAGVYENISKIRFTIDSVYNGQKWKDTCIGEIKIEKIN